MDIGGRVIATKWRRCSKHVSTKIQRRPNNSLQLSESSPLKRRGKTPRRQSLKSRGAQWSSSRRKVSVRKLAVAAATINRSMCTET